MDRAFDDLSIHYIPTAVVIISPQFVFVSLICVFLQSFSLTKKEKAWCVDPRAWWLPDRLKKLERVSQTQTIIINCVYMEVLLKMYSSIPSISVLTCLFGRQCNILSLCL